MGIQIKVAKRTKHKMLLVFHRCCLRLHCELKAGIFARRAMVDQASATREKLNILVYLTYKESPVLTYHNFVLRKFAIIMLPLGHIRNDFVILFHLAMES